MKRNKISDAVTQSVASEISNSVSFARRVVQESKLPMPDDEALIEITLKALDLTMDDIRENSRHTSLLHGFAALVRTAVSAWGIEQPLGCNECPGKYDALRYASKFYPPKALNGR